MKPVKTNCPNPQCKLKLVIPEEACGQRVRCAACGHSFIVPILRPSRFRSTSTRRTRKAS